MATRIQVRRGSTTDWSTANPVLAAGEIGFDTTTSNVKIGDGSTAWNSLPYQLPYATGARASSLSATLSIDNDNDRVGIGTTTPSEKLDVVGNVVVSGDIAVNGGDITTSSATLNLAGTITGAQTVNIATGVTTTGNTKTVNIATGGDTGSTTNINIGSASGGTLAVLKNATVAGTLAVTGVISGPGTIPIGGIIMWSGASVPSGWQLCDGSNGTPNLTNRFVMCGSAYGRIKSMSSDAWYETLTDNNNFPYIGGDKDAVLPSHTHTGTTSSNGLHTHTAAGLVLNGSPKNVDGLDSASLQHSGQTVTTNETGAHTHTFVTQSSGVSAVDKNLPPYFVLAFIMRMT